jgi:hypothetical protein
MWNEIFKIENNGTFGRETVRSESTGKRYQPSNVQTQYQSKQDIFMDYKKIIHTKRIKNKILHRTTFLNTKPTGFSMSAAASENLRILHTTFTEICRHIPVLDLIEQQ